MAEVKTEVKGLKEDLKGSQKAQVWTSITVLLTALVGAIIRFAIAALPGNPLSRV